MRIDWRQQWTGPGIGSQSIQTAAAPETATPASFMADWRAANWHLLGAGWAWTGQAITDAAPPPTPNIESFSGGFLHEYERSQARRVRHRKELREREAQAQRLPDDASREIAQLLHEQERRDEERADLERLRELARAHRQSRDTAELTARVKQAYARVLAQENFSALQALDRELQRMLEEEEITALMILLNED